MNSKATPTLRLPAGGRARTAAGVSEHADEAGLPQPRRQAHPRRTEDDPSPAIVPGPSQKPMAMTTPADLFGLMFRAVVEGTLRLATSGAFDSSGALLVAIGGALLLLVNTILVFILAWFRPENVMYGLAGHPTEGTEDTKDRPSSKNKVIRPSRRATLRGKPVP